MLTPSYSEIMDVLNRDCDKERRAVTSRYSIVIAASKRARQIVAGSPFDATGVKTDKAVSIAIGEISRGLVRVYPDGCDEPEPVYHTAHASDESAYKAYYGESRDDEEDSFLRKPGSYVIPEPDGALAEEEEFIPPDEGDEADDGEWDVSEDVV